MPVTFNELVIAVRPDPEVPEGGEGRNALVLQPGEEGVLIAIKATDERKPLQIFEHAVNQHKNSEYTYIIDGVGRTLPMPLGTLINPAFPCRDWGAYLQAREFTIVVKNVEPEGSTETTGGGAHTYAGRVVYKEPT